MELDCSISEFHHSDISWQLTPSIANWRDGWILSLLLNKMEECYSTQTEFTLLLFWNRSYNQIPLWCQPEFDVWTLANISMSCSCRPDNVKLTSIWISAAITRIARIIIIVSIFIYFRHATKSIEPAVFPWWCPRSSGKGRVTSENLPNKVRHCIVTQFC